LDHCPIRQRCLQQAEQPNDPKLFHQSPNHELTSSY
jgi:hypothetical protein